MSVYLFTHIYIYLYTFINIYIFTYVYLLQYLPCFPHRMVLLGSITDLVGSGTTPADLPRADFGESRPVDVFEPLKVALLIGSTTEPYNMFHNIYI